MRNYAQFNLRKNNARIMSSASPSDKKKDLSKKEIPVQPGSRMKAAPKPEKKKKQIRTPLPGAKLSGVNPFTVVAIGASAGGLEAVTQLLQNLSSETGMAYIYAQHLSPDHKSILSSLLARVTKMKVQDIANMDKMEPDNVYVIPYNKEIEVTDGHLKLAPRPINKSSNLSIDVLFSSLAETHKENVIGIILSGSATDGTRGLKEIKLAGGITFAQDDSAKFKSMPESAIAEGVVDFVLSPKEIAEKLTWISKHPLEEKTSIKSTPKGEIDNSNPHLKNILQIIHHEKKVDFSHYKISTIKRRMLRRMMINKIETIKQYEALIAQENNEVNLLCQDLLINVTSFFRDAEAFHFFQKTILPRLMEGKADGDTLRLWVAACATGEEVYSIAMLLIETAEKLKKNISFQIFATDLSANAIKEARRGEYTLRQLGNVSPNRIKHFFTNTNGRYRISKNIRDLCIFAQHNILGDPPFSRIDFISCRNFLIYLDTPAQKMAIKAFHFALNNGGILMLGKSETIGSSAQLFIPLSKKVKCYSRKNNSGVFRIPEITPRNTQTVLSEMNDTTTPNIKKKPDQPNVTLGAAFDSILLEHYVPASVIINHEMEILQFRGATSSYLQLAPGKASFNILKMAPVEITFELRNAIHHAIKTRQTVRKMGIEMNRDEIGNTIQIVNLEVMPLETAGEEPLLVVVFSGQKAEVMMHPTQDVKHYSIAKDRRIKKLEEELASARADMDSITHDQETANEELQTANEEIVSSNEELQTLNEELETSKEEIESTNEELTTSNHELSTRIRQVEELYNYYEAILATIHEPMLILDKNIRIKSANRSFCKTFYVTEAEIVGLSFFKLGNNQWNIPRLRELLFDTVSKDTRFHNFEVEHIFPVIGQKTMLLNAHRINMPSQDEEFIVLTILDITKVKRMAIEIQEKEKEALKKHLEIEQKAMQRIEDSNKRYNMMLLQSPFSIAIVQGKDMVITLANDSIKEMWGKGKHLEGKPMLEILSDTLKEQIPLLLENVYTTGTPYYGYERHVSIKRDGKLTDAYFNFVYQPYREADGSISGVTIIAYEVTAALMAKNELIEAKNNAERARQIAEVAVKAKQQFLSNMSHEIRTPMNAIIGFTNVVLKTKLDESQREYINAIKVSGDALIVLINDILDIAKVDSGKMFFEQIPLNLSASISTMLNLFEAKITEKNLELSVKFDHTIPQILIGDPLRLRQIILNLLSNAVKFTAIGKITVSVHLLKEDEEKVTIEFAITDTGIGIPKEKLSLIFNNFEQASVGTSSSYGGTGLGLAIVKQLVEHQGGTISLKSEPGKGSTFGFILSFGKTNSQAELEADLGMEMIPKEPFEEVAIKNVKVLVAEDIALNQLLIKIILLDFGFEMDIAGNGKIAIEYLKKNSYDIILMDLQMPVMDGFEATAFIRSKMKSKIPIIALTADVTTMDVEKSLSVGMNDYIPKPIDEKLLYSKIIKYIKKPGKEK